MSNPLRVLIGISTSSKIWEGSTICSRLLLYYMILELHIFARVHLQRNNSQSISIIDDPNPPAFYHETRDEKRISSCFFTQVKRFQVKIFVLLWIRYVHSTVQNKKKKTNIQSNSTNSFNCLIFLVFLFSILTVPKISSKLNSKQLGPICELFSSYKFKYTVFCFKFFSRKKKLYCKQFL